jgi:hypothetical protein
VYTGGSPVSASAMLPNFGVMLKTKKSSQLPQLFLGVVSGYFFLQQSGSWVSFSDSCMPQS